MMLIVFTRDAFLFEAIAHFYPGISIMCERHIPELTADDLPGLKIIIDTLYNNIVHHDIIRRASLLFPESIIVLSAFRIKFFLADLNIKFLKRNCNPEELIDVLNDKAIIVKSMLTITYTQHAILSMLVSGSSKMSIAEKSGISVKTVHSHIHGLRKLFGLSRICDIHKKKEYFHLIKSE